MKNQDLIISEVKKIISEEIRFLKTYYPYDLQYFYPHESFYGAAFMVFFNIEEIRNFDLSQKYEVNNYTDEKDNIVFFDTYKVINLVAGVELIAIGLNIHATYDTLNTLNENSSVSPDNQEKRTEKNYTVELLFGDIFYSRAISHLINFDDFNIFDNILKAILSVHRARIIIHKKIKDSLADSNEILWFFDKGVSEIKLFNSLLKEMFLTGISLSNFDISKKRMKDFLIIINEVVLLKTYNELADRFVRKRPEGLLENSERTADFFYYKTENIKKDLDIKINKLQPGWIRKNFLELFLKYR